VIPSCFLHPSSLMLETITVTSHASHIPKVGIVPRSARSDRNSDAGACDEVKLRLTTHHKQPQVFRPPPTVMSGGWNTIESDAVRSLSASHPSITNVHRASSHI
jgi:hypothetical protein